MALSTWSWLTSSVGSTETITVDGTRLAFASEGPVDGEVVVLLHGYVGSHRTWRHQLGPLGERHRVYALDWFGWGDSERDPTLAYDYDTEVGRLGRVLAELGVQRASLVGHDYGGFLALGFTLRHPAQVARLAIVNSRAHGTFNAHWSAVFGAVGALCQTRGGRAFLRALPLGAIFRRSMKPLVRRGYLDDATLGHYVGWMAEDPLGPAYLTRFHQDYRLPAREALGRSLGTIACPAAVVWGARDAYLPARIAEELASDIPGCVLTLVEDAGHFLPEERPAVVTEALVAWMARRGELTPQPLGASPRYR